MKEVFIEEGKVLKHDEKSILDTLQVVQNVNSDSINKAIERCSDLTQDILKSTSSIFPSKGKVLYLEVVVEDSLLASLLYEWLYVKSKFDNNNLHVFGCTLNSIYFNKPGFTDEERNLIKQLNNKVNGY